jgi:hypothetical protein
MNEEREREEGIKGEGRDKERKRGREEEREGGRKRLEIY